MTDIGLVDWSFSKRKKDEEEELRGVISCYVTMGMERKKNIFELIFFPFNSFLVHCNRSRNHRRAKTLQTFTYPPVSRN